MFSQTIGINHKSERLTVLTDGTSLNQPLIYSDRRARVEGGGWLCAPAESRSDIFVSLWTRRVILAPAGPAPPLFARFTPGNRV